MTPSRSDTSFAGKSDDALDERRTPVTQSASLELSLELLKTTICPRSGSPNRYASPVGDHAVAESALAELGRLWRSGALAPSTATGCGTAWPPALRTSRTKAIATAIVMSQSMTVRHGCGIRPCARSRTLMAHIHIVRTGSSRVLRSRGTGTVQASGGRSWVAQAV